MGNKVFLDGKLVDREEAKVSVFDHGLLYGDGIFEGIRVYSRCIFKLKEHLDRLFESAHSIMLSIPMTKNEIENAIIKTLKANRLSDGYIRLVVTRGVGDLGLDPNKCKVATIFIITDKIKLYPEEFYRKGLAIVTVPTMRNLPETLNPSIKSLNYLNNIMAKIEACNAGCIEAIMLNKDGYVLECTGDNVFIVKRGKLITPPTYLGALEGITRNAIIECAKKLKIACEERILTRHDLFNADEIFLTGTAAELIPVVEVDKRTIGDGKSGAISLKLLKAFRAITPKDGVKYSL
ncbi:MAG: branched-chain-amino-acid transaminase [Candidatus Omnitrophica bacterium]|nr:branched-chain-amino-acid transaminase [Candidatus Omnitrophota bacterium]